MHHMRDVLGRRARRQPFFHLRIEIDGARTGHRLGAADVVKQDLGQSTEPDRAEAFRHAPWPIRGRRIGQAQRASGVRKEFRVVDALRRAGQLQHEVRRRKGDDLVGGFVIIKIIVIVLEKEDRSGAKVGAVDRNDLRARGALQHRLIVAAENDCRPIECSGGLHRFRRRAEKARSDRREEIPVKVIAIGDHGVRLEAQPAPQESIAHHGRQELVNLMTAGTGVDQDAKVPGALARGRKRR